MSDALVSRERTKTTNQSGTALSTCVTTKPSRMHFDYDSWSILLVTVILCRTMVHYILSLIKEVGKNWEDSCPPALETMLRIVNHLGR